MGAVHHTDLTNVSKLTRKDIIPFYVDLICRGTDPEVVRINNLILTKWSVSGLLWIKEKAWKIVEKHQSK